MARTTKPGIEYFSHDTDMAMDKKTRILRAKHGLVGYAVYTMLLEEIYRDEGYFLKAEDDFNILFSSDVNLDYDVYILILNECIELGLFDKFCYNEYSIITSKRIQNNYCDATERRKQVNICGEYLLIDLSKKNNPGRFNVYNLDLNVDIEALNDDIGTQSKVEETESKVEKSIEEEPSSSEQSPDLKFANDRDSIQFKLVGFLAKRMRDNNPKCRLPKEGSKQLDSWCIEIDRMMRLDGREPSEIRRVIDWSQNDDFWKSNILSPKALRKQYDKLFVKMQKPKNKEDRIKANAMSPEVQAWLNSED